MPRILVTGAAGFIGRATCQALRRAHLDYLAADKSPFGQVVACDLEDRASLSLLFAGGGFDAMIHLASMLPGAASMDPLKAARVNVDGSLALLDAAMAARVPRFIFASSTSVYGSAGLSSPISEQMPASPCDVYGGAKRFVEIVGESLRRQGKLEFVSLRIATVIGPGARNTSSPWRSEIFERLGSQTRQIISLPYSAEDRLTVVHVEDVARMLVRLAEAQSVREMVYNTPAQLVAAGDLKRLIEKVDPRTEVELAGRSRPLAPLGDGASFAKEFSFEIPSLESRLKEQASGN